MKRKLRRLTALLAALCLLLTLAACRKPPEAEEETRNPGPTSAPSHPEPSAPDQQTAEGEDHGGESASVLEETEPNDDPDLPEMTGESGPDDPVDGPDPADPSDVPDPTEPVPPEPSGGREPTSPPTEPTPEAQDQNAEIAGYWSSELALDWLLAARLSEDSLNDMPVPTFPDVNLTLWLDLGEDGSLHMCFDPDSLERAQADMHAPLRQYLLDYFSSEYGLDEEAVEGILAAQGTSLDEKVDELAEGFRLGGLDEVDVRGWYLCRDGRLYLGDDPEALEDYYEIELDGDMLVLLSVSDEEKLPTFVKLLPLFFYREDG